MSKLEIFLFGSNIILYFLLTIFSYAYTDLNLTLSQNPLVLKFIGNMQHIGYFNRPLSTIIYILLIVFVFILYLFHLWFFKKNKISLTYLKISSISNVIILIFAYPFLSSDLFNYIFDAKIIVTYHLNPYTHKALDFPNDDWIRFMRWTHRYSPYGPLWIVLSCVPAILGFGKFILNFLMFKIFIAIFHLVNTLLIYKILKKTNPEILLFGTSFYALNPLFLIEGVVNAHNDVLLTTFLILSLYFLINKKTLNSLVMLVLGFFIKYIPILNLPWLVLAFFSKEKNHKRHIYLCLITLGIFTYIFSSFGPDIPFISKGSTQVQFQPWYLFWTLPFVALIPSMWLTAAAISLSFGATLRYLPNLYYGDWNHIGTIQFMTTVTIVPLVFVLFITVIVKTLRLGKSYGKAK